MALAAARNLVVYGPLVAGFALLIGGRVVGAIGDPSWTAAALFLLGASCLLEVALPGGSKLTDQQIAALRHMRVPYREGMERAANFAAGVALVAGGLWFALA